MGMSSYWLSQREKVCEAYVAGNITEKQFRLEFARFAVGRDEIDDNLEALNEQREWLSDFKASVAAKAASHDQEAS